MKCRSNNLSINTILTNRAGTTACPVYFTTEIKAEQTKRDAPVTGAKQHSNTRRHEASPKLKNGETLRGFQYIR